MLPPSFQCSVPPATTEGASFTSPDGPQSPKLTPFRPIPQTLFPSLPPSSANSARVCVLAYPAGDALEPEDYSRRTAGRFPRTEIHVILDDLNTYKLQDDCWLMGHQLVGIITRVRMPFG